MNKIVTLISLVVLINSLFSEDDKNPFDGEYQIRPGFNIVVSTDNSDLYVYPTGKPKEKLTKISESLFKIESINGTVDFSLIEENERIVIKMYGQIIHARKLPLKEIKEERIEIKISGETLNGLQGEYKLNSDANFYVKVDDSSLYVEITGQPEFEVYPFAENKFFYKVVDASIEFVKNEKGDVSYLLLYQNGIIMQADKVAVN